MSTYAEPIRVTFRFEPEIEAESHSLAWKT